MRKKLLISCSSLRSFLNATPNRLSPNYPEPPPAPAAVTEPEDDDGETALIHAARQGHFDTAEETLSRLLKSKVDADETDERNGVRIHKLQQQQQQMMVHNPNGDQNPVQAAAMRIASRNWDLQRDGRIGKAIELFNMLKEKDDFVWIVIISGFVSNDEFEEALRWYVRMNQEGCGPNPVTISSSFASSAALAALNEGLQIHSHVLKMNLEHDLSIQNSLISFYAKCGNVTDAYKIFIDVDEPNVVSCNSVVNGFAQNGFGEEALDIYKRMQNESLEHNHVTFLAVLSACTHAGLIEEEGWNLFNTTESNQRSPITAVNKNNYWVG
ncbi:hypothetical protein KIW84_054187 [Lathyrus oleraceus]|uniref:Pentatricopeptide repeat-containing protein n=1 Tax=Pisum sativum TaxID=3888 RepID=A0A9D4WX18_PEA|nr:hypothetical protein KIW84_054187 [Pisum sativum]